MPWHEIPLQESIWRLSEAVAEPTNPSSFILAIVGVGTYLCYQILARPGRERSRPIDSSQSATNLQAASAEAVREERRVA